MATVECDSTYACVASNGLPTHTMMEGRWVDSVMAETEKGQHADRTRCWNFRFTTDAGRTTLVLRT